MMKVFSRLVEVGANVYSCAWQNVIDAIERNDAHTRGIVILGLGESEEKLDRVFP